MFYGDPSKYAILFPLDAIFEAIWILIENQSRDPLNVFVGAIVNR